MFGDYKLISESMSAGCRELVQWGRCFHCRPAQEEGTAAAGGIQDRIVLYMGYCHQSTAK